MHDRVWLKRVLIPFWVFELAFLLTVAVFAGLDIAAYAYFLQDEDEYSSSRRELYATAMYVSNQ